MSMLPISEGSSTLLKFLPCLPASTLRTFYYSLRILGDLLFINLLCPLLQVLRGGCRVCRQAGSVRSRGDSVTLADEAGLIRTRKLTWSPHCCYYPGAIKEEFNIMWGWVSVVPTVREPLWAWAAELEGSVICSSSATDTGPLYLRATVRYFFFYFSRDN